MIEQSHKHGVKIEEKNKVILKGILNDEKTKKITLVGAWSQVLKP
jgi:hypothetical protein